MRPLGFIRSIFKEDGANAVLLVPVAAQRADPSTGAVAQLGERLHGMQEVVGSIPISSTILIK